MNKFHKDNIVHTLEMGDGKTIYLETGLIARQADGAVVVRMGNTILLASVVSAKEGKENADFMPLSVDYQEKFSASGRIPGGFLRRESRLSDYEILISRLVDRALRPLFPEDYHAETQVLISLLSADKNIMPDALATLAASSALTISDIPFNGPVSEVRVARIKGVMHINPYITELAEAELDLIVAGTIDNIIMVEGEMNEQPESVMLEAIRYAHQFIKKQCTAQLKLRELTNSKVKRIYSHENNDEELRAKLNNELRAKTNEIAKGKHSKKVRTEMFKKLHEDFSLSFPEADDKRNAMIKRYFHDLEKEVIREIALNEKIRLDGRKLEQIRPIWCGIDCLPSTHGSSIFTRGETQAISSVTLGTKLDEQLIDGAMFKGFNRFMLHYNFPSFSTGEVKPNRGPGRREVGHGNLAMRSLKKILPAKENNPYTIRIISDILESNGSSSMATVCAGTLALMDSGIKIKSPVSGIAMGLVSDLKTGKYSILSDILGDEDHLGDMDFKVTGTKNGIVACQMDIKMGGIRFEILEEALEQARKGRLFILDEMLKVISEPRADLKPHAPRITLIPIDKEFIGPIIGPGGKNIQQIQRDTNTIINIEEVEDKGIVQIAATDMDSMNKAVQLIKSIITIPTVGDIYNGTVKSIMPYGAFIEILPKKEGLLHISEIAWERTEDTNNVFKLGQKVEVKLMDIENGKYRLSRKVLLPKPGKVVNTF